MLQAAVMLCLLCPTCLRGIKASMHDWLESAGGRQAQRRRRSTQNGEGEEQGEEEDLQSEESGSDSEGSLLDDALREDLSEDEMDPDHMTYEVLPAFLVPEDMFISVCNRAAACVRVSGQALSNSTHAEEVDAAAAACVYTQPHASQQGAPDPLPTRAGAASAGGHSRHREQGAVSRGHRSAAEPCARGAPDGAAQLHHPTRLHLHHLLLRLLLLRH